MSFRVFCYGMFKNNRMRQKKKRQTDVVVGRQYQRLDRDFISSIRAAENRIRWKWIVVNSPMVPRQPSKLMG